MFMRLLPVALLGIAASGCASQDPCAEGVPGTVCPIAGTGDMAFNHDGLPATETAFFLPSEVRRGPDGLLYIMDFNNQRIRRIELDGTVSTIAGDGFHAGAIEGSVATDSSLENPIDFDFLPDGRLVFVSYHDPRVLMIDHDGTLQLVAGNAQPGIRGDEGDGGPADQAQFIETVGITVAPDGAIYISDPMANRVRVIRDGMIDTLAGTGFAGGLGDGGPAKAAALNEPSALTLDATGNLYISDAANCTVRRITPDGTISSVAGSNVHGYSGDGGPALVATLALPDGIAVGPDGTLYIGDRFNSRVRKVTPDGTITTIAGTGTRGYSGDGGPAVEAELGYISRVQLDSDGGLLISDQSNSTIRKILPPF